MADLHIICISFACPVSPLQRQALSSPVWPPGGLGTERGWVGVRVGFTHWCPRVFLLYLWPAQPAQVTFLSYLRASPPTPCTSHTLLSRHDFHLSCLCPSLFSSTLSSFKARHKTLVFHEDSPGHTAQSYHKTIALSTGRHLKKPHCFILPVFR